ncbi:hypothetical protein ACM66B_000749 [Microbotryomycetes sp. NB124-2]
MAIPFIVGAGSKLFLQAGCNEVRVDGLAPFVERIKSPRGVVTIANHVSVMDEPLMWGILPIHTFYDSRTVRWTLGASDIMFTRKLDSWFFRKGQVIETFRGKGIYQRAIDEATEKLDEGRWVHLFPEGKIKQEDLFELRRFKWGVSRMLMECNGARGGELPLIIPIWIQGFEQVMDEERGFPRFLPRLGKNVQVIIGEPINDRIEPLVEEYRRKFPKPWRPVTYSRDVQADLKDEPKELARLRSKMAEVMREEVMKLGARAEEQLKRPPDRIKWGFLPTSETASDKNVRPVEV